MKKNLFALMAGFITALATINVASAQNSNAISVLNNNMPVEKTFKSDMLTEPAKANTATISAINAKAVKNFTKSYKGVTGANWDLTDEGFRVKFAEGDIKNSIFYNKKGGWTGSMKTYSEDNLPKDVRKVVKREYYDFNIYQAQEVVTIESADNIPTYIIYLEGKDSYKMLLVNDYNITVWKDYKK